MHRTGLACFIGWQSAPKSSHSVLRVKREGMREEVTSQYSIASRAALEGPPYSYVSRGDVYCWYPRVHKQIVWRLCQACVLQSKWETKRGCILVPLHSTYRSPWPDDLMQWLKYKFWGPGTLKKLGPYRKLKGPLCQPAGTINGCMGPGNARQQFLGAHERRSPAFPNPPYFNHWYSHACSDFFLF